jgi:hypothetical protein
MFENLNTLFFQMVVVLNHCENKGEMKLYTLTVTAMPPPQAFIRLFCPLKTIFNHSVLSREAVKGF